MSVPIFYDQVQIGFVPKNVKNILHIWRREGSKLYLNFDERHLNMQAKKLWLTHTDSTEPREKMLVMVGVAPTSLVCKALIQDLIDSDHLKDIWTHTSNR